MPCNNIMNLSLLILRDLAIWNIWKRRTWESSLSISLVSSILACTCYLEKKIFQFNSRSLNFILRMFRWLPKFWLSWIPNSESTRILRIRLADPGDAPVNSANLQKMNKDIQKMTLSSYLLDVSRGVLTSFRLVFWIPASIKRDCLLSTGQLTSVKCEREIS